MSNRKGMRGMTEKWTPGEQIEVGTGSDRRLGTIRWVDEGRGVADIDWSDGDRGEWPLDELRMPARVEGKPPEVKG